MLTLCAWLWVCLQHFVCAKCEKPFLGHRHYERKGLAYCETHYNQVTLVIHVEHTKEVLHNSVTCVRFVALLLTLCLCLSSSVTLSCLEMFATTATV